MDKKRAIKNKLQRCLKRLTALCLVFSVISIYGCNNAAKIEDYPTVVITEDENVEEIQTDETNSEDKNESEDNTVSDKEVLEPEVNSFKETGVYVYNPAVIPDWILEEMQDNPKLIRVAKEFLIAVDNLEEEYVLPEDITLTEDEIEIISYILYFSTPISSEILYYETENKNVCHIAYFPYGEQLEEEASLDEAREKMEIFRGYVTDIINNNLTSDMSEKEMAAILYKKILMDFKFDPESTDDYLSPSYETFSESGIVNCITNQEMPCGIVFFRLYSFLLTQLHINNRSVGGSGFFKNEIKDELGDKAPISYGWVWQLLQLDGEYYYCDILLEKLMQNAKYGVELGTEPDMAYFGMSETKRMESYKFGKASAGLYETFDTTAAPAPLPDCPNDYEYH